MTFDPFAHEREGARVVTHLGCGIVTAVTRSSRGIVLALRVRLDDGAVRTLPAGKVRAAA